jgi:exonuclease III
MTLQASIIFLSDIRLNSSNHKVENIFAPTYNLHHNSPHSKRGVGILIKTNLNCTVTREHCDNKGNILGLKVIVDNNSLLLLGIYGPNTNDPEFFNKLQCILNDNRGTPTIIAGDWNLTYSTDDNDSNIDVINMLSPPSIPRSKSLADICESHVLTDPYRALHPYKRDYTYVPRSGKTNRSRIDFFIISEFLVHLVNFCDISASLDTFLFDHKSIHLSFMRPKKTPNNIINQKIFSHPRFDAVVAVATVETYLQHAAPDPDLDIEEGLREVGNIISKIQSRYL